MSEFERGERYDSTRKGWELIWHGASMQQELEAVMYRRAQATIRAYLPYLAPDDAILEAGSGLSAVVMTLRRMGYRVMGLDYAVNALRISRAYDGSLPLVAGDVHHLPFGDGDLGGYLSFGVLEHFEHGMQPALREAHRVLRVGGTLVLTIPYPNVIYQVVGWRKRMAGQQRLNDESFYESAYTRQQLSDEVTRAGFRVMKVQPTSHAFTLWGLGGIFRAKGYYKTSVIAEILGDMARWFTPWALNFMTLIIAQKES